MITDEVTALGFSWKAFTAWHMTGAETIQLCMKDWNAPSGLQGATSIHRVLRVRHETITFQLILWAFHCTTLSFNIITFKCTSCKSALKASFWNVLAVTASVCSAMFPIWGVIWEGAPPGCRRWKAPASSPWWSSSCSPIKNPVLVNGATP